MAKTFYLRGTTTGLSAAEAKAAALKEYPAVARPLDRADWFIAALTENPLQPGMVQFVLTESEQCAFEIVDIIVDDAAPKKPVNPASTLFDDVGYDSLGIVGLAVALEERFDLSLTDDHIESWKTVGDVILTVGLLLEQKAS